MLYQSQRDPQWSTKKLGNSICSMGSYGCTTTSIANVLNLDVLAVLNTAQYLSNGSIIWQSCNFNNYVFSQRIRQYDRNRLKIAGKDPNTKIILEVINRQSPTGRHWVALGSLGFGGYNTVDPYDSNSRIMAKKAFYTIYQVLGHAEFIKK